MREPLSATSVIDGAKLRAARVRRGYSQQSLADRVGISRSYLADMERGRRTNPRQIVIDQIAGALGMEPERLAPR